MTNLPLRRTSLIIPRRPTHLFTRQRLLDSLYDLLDHRLIIISAPAGYGKTSLLIDLADQVELPVCWYSLDALDQDPRRFIAHLLASIAQRFPGFGREAAAVLQSTTPTSLDLEHLVRIIVNEAYEHIREHFILVLDDYHLVNGSKAIDHFVSRLVQQVDENCHLILSSRTLLNLPDLALMVGRSQVGGLDFEELAFRAAEIQALVLQNYHLLMSTPEAEKLARETEGWITGLQLSAQTMWQGMADRVRLARVSGVGLYDYLAQQVLNQQPVPVRDFLLRTSLLEEFDAQLCQAVLGADEDWQGLMDIVLQNNLFVLPVDDRGTWLRYHHLFRDFLQARLAQAHPDEHERILRRLATVYAEREEWEKAHAIYQQLGDAAATADLIERSGSLMVKSGRLTILAAWLDALPVDLAARPSLLSWRGIVAVMLGQMERGLSLLNQAETAFRTTGDLLGLAFTLERRTVAHRFLGQYQASLSDADETLALSAGDERLRAVRAAALRARGLALRWEGQLDEAIEWLEQSLTAYSALDDAHNVAMLYVELGLASMNAGRYGRALAHYERALAYWQQVNNVVRQATLFNNLGVLYQLQGDYEQAVLLLEQALDCARRSGYTRIEAMALSGMGDLYADLDAVQAARDAYRQAYHIARRLDHRFLLLYLNLAQATLARSSGDLPQARRQLEAARQLVQESSSSYEQGLWQLESGRVALTEGNVPGAIVSLEEAARRFENGGQQGEGACTYLHLAAACHAAEDEKAALAHLERAFLLAARLESQHRLVVAAREATALPEAIQRDPTLDQQVARLLGRVSRWEQEIPTLRRRLRRQTVTVPFAPPRLTIQALGRARVMLGGEVVTDPEWRSRKVVRDLFFLLLAHPEGLSKESIGTIFWPECSPSQLKLRFKNSIYRLRRALGQDVVLFDQDGYRFNQALDYEYDVQAFLRKVAQAQATTAPNEQLAAYRAAVDLYQGPYLPEVDETWVWPERERLRRAYVEAILKLALLYLETGAHEETLNYCQRVLNQNPCQERAHRLAMRAYAAIGNKAAVAHQFEHCQQALRQETNAPPSPQTQLLYESLMR